MSSLARLLDWLSAKYNILFIISAGNHSRKISLNISRSEFEALHSDQLEEIIIRYLFEDSRHRRLLSPGESINGITVGAVHHDNSTLLPPAHNFNPFEKILPSPISSFGSGYRRSIKPDIVFLGGKQWYGKPILSGPPVELDIRNFLSPPGMKVAHPGNVTGQINGLAYSRGTSISSALITRAAGICYESLLEVFHDQVSEIKSELYIPSLLKTMLVHGCAWGEKGECISNILTTPQNAREIKAWVSRWLGYGMPDISRVLECSEQRATLLGFGHLLDNAAHIFHLPLPPSLASQSEWRRLTITLGWITPVSPNTQKYRNASLWFGATNDLTPDRMDADWQAVRRGTVQHEVFEGESAEPFIDGDTIEIKINCKKDAGDIVNPIPYGLAVSLEVSEGVNISIYDEIRARIRPPIQIQ